MTRTYELYFFEFELRHPKSWPNLMCFPLRFWEHSAHSTNWNCGGAIVTSRSLLDMVMRLHGNWKYTQIQNKAHQTFDNIIMLISDCTNASSSHGLWIAIHSAVTSFSLVATVAQQANESTFSPGISPRIANVPIVLAREKQQIQKQLNWYPTPQDETTMCCHGAKPALLCSVEWPYPISTTAWLTTESLPQVSSKMAGIPKGLRKCILCGFVKGSFC